jgi:HAD superfamily hydrolase (TIGR01458 family)
MASAEAKLSGLPRLRRLPSGPGRALAEESGYGRGMPDKSAVLIDIDGVLTVSWEPLPGAVEALSVLRGAGLGIRLITNTTSKTRGWLARTLAGAGFEVAAEDIMTAPALTAEYLARHYPHARCHLLSSGDTAAELEGVHLVGPGEPADVVVLGGAGPEFSYPAVNEVFSLLRAGAALVAMHQSLYWATSAGMELDSGAYLAGLEKAAGVQAEVIGKPSPACFATALASVGTEPGQAVMVGDDVETDVLAAQACGLTGVLVKTGKFGPDTLPGASGIPNHVINSFADLPSLLGL